MARSLAGIAPWWVVLETRGRRSGLARRVPLAKGVAEGPIMWLISVHGEQAAFARNIGADPHVRLKLAGRWREGSASLAPVDEELLSRFSAYAQSGRRVFGIEPRLVRVELD